MQVAARTAKTMTGILEWTAAGADFAGALVTAVLNPRAASPQNELNVARSAGFRKVVQVLSAMTSAMPLAPPDGVQTRPITVSKYLDGVEFLPGRMLENRVILYLHGGAHCMGSAASHSNLLGRLAEAACARVVAVNYRLAPEHPFPAGLEDALEALEWTRRTYPSAAVAIAGDSAGGNLAFSMMVKLAQQGERQPVACAGLSAWLLLDVDQAPKMRAEHKSSCVCNVWGGEALVAIQKLAAGIDWKRAVPNAYMAGKMHDVLAAQYFQEHPASDPLVSPVLAPVEIVRRFPPVLLHSSRDEPLNADAREMASLCTRAGVRVEYEEFDNTSHVFQAFPQYYPCAARDSIAKIAKFFNDAWAQQS